MCRSPLYRRIVGKNNLDVGIHPSAAIPRGDTLGGKFSFRFQSGFSIKEVLKNPADQEESRSISDNVKWGIRKRMAEGIPNGRSRVYGYRWEGDGLVTGCVSST